MGPVIEYRVMHQGTQPNSPAQTGGPKNNQDTEAY